MNKLHQIQINSVTLSILIFLLSPAEYPFDFTIDFLNIFNFE